MIRKPAPLEIYSFKGFHNRAINDELPTYDDLLYMDYKSISAWVKKSKPDDVAGVIYDLIDQIQYYEDEQYYTDRLDLDAPLDRTPYHY